jgi:cell wall-associated NlpC family hydrolase
MARREPKRVSFALAALAAFAFVLVPASAEARFGDRTLKKGSQGSDVTTLQKYLRRLGYRVSADGQYGTVTVRKVKRFERDKRRLVNGRVEPSDARLITRLAARAGAQESSGGSTYSAPPPNATGKATLQSDGTAVAPASAPQRVKDVIAAANQIVTKPYRYGGGHGSFNDSGYDCSGAVSYAMHGGAFVSQPLDSTGFMSWAHAGAGTWITTYANSGHVYAMIAGLRWDTSGSGGQGPRWHSDTRSASGYTVRHPRGF